MKKLFYGLGVLLVLFSTLQFMLVAEAKIYKVENKKPYSIELDKAISAEEVEKVAVDNNVMLVNREYINNIFGERYTKCYIFNPSENVKEGKHKAIYSDSTAEYIFANNSLNKRMYRLNIFTDNPDDVSKVRASLEKNNYACRVEEDFDLKISYNVLFNFATIKFYLLIGVLSVICIISYYVYRLKEIGILRLNGWNSLNISWKIMKDMIKNTIIGFVIPMLLFLIFVIFRNYIFALEYIKSCIMVMCFQLIIYILSGMFATIFIKGVNQVSAVKYFKNNKLMFRILVLAKVITIMFLFLEINSVTEKLIYNKDINDGYELVSKSDLYGISLHAVLEENVMDRIKQDMLTIPDDCIFNYDTKLEEDVFSSVEIKKMLKKGCYNKIDNTMCVSTSMVDRLNVKGTDGNYVKYVHLPKGGALLLIPEHYKSNVNEIKNVYEDRYSNLTIRYIEDNQYFASYRAIGKYVYEPIIVVENVIKTPTIGQGAVYLNSNGKKQLESILEKYNIDKDVIKITSLIDENKEMKVTNEINTIQNTIYLIISIISYGMVAISIILIYLEFRKKHFGVYTLLGKYPVAEIVYLAAINIIIVTGAALIINKSLLVVILVEMALYAYMVYNYLNKKAILAIKGE